MPRLALTGSRIRAKRLEISLKQADLAKKAGISPAYLNLIEHNKRRIGGKLLLDLARELQVDASVLSEGAGAVLVASLQEAAKQNRQQDLGRVDEFASRYPGWAALVATQHGHIAGLEHRVAMLTDRLSHDPQLSAALHELLSSVTAIRSTAAILVGEQTVEPQWQARFQRNLYEDAKRLADGASVLANYLDVAEAQEPVPTEPQEELESWLEKRNFHLAELERGGDITDAKAGDMLQSYLQRYRGDAARLPLKPFLAAYESGDDPLQLAGKFGVDLATVLRRIASLPRSKGQANVGLLICDASGTLLLRKPLDGFPLPRFGSGCPLWPLYQALARPQVPLRQPIEHTSGDGPQFMTYAIAQPIGLASFDNPPMFESTMLIIPKRRNGTGDGILRVCSQGGCGGQH
jgi:predicted transcriptional regulator/DNA-binding XRE family transcriptional regulator